MGERDIPATADCAGGDVAVACGPPPRSPRRRIPQLDEHPARPPGREDALAPRFEAIPKPSGGLRWLTRLDRAGLARYEAAVGPLVGRIERTLGPEVHAIHARRSGSGWGVVPWRPARRAWRRALRSAVGGAGPGTAFATADIRDCYGSISPGTIRAILGPDADGLARLLASFAEAGVRGLPIGPDPSAFLANAVLARLDETLRRAGVEHVRWVDDVIAWGDAGDVRRALDHLAASAAALGLELHDRKTGVLADRDEAGTFAPSDRDSSIIAAP
jgi:hypothetical protein